MGAAADKLYVDGTSIELNFNRRAQISRAADAILSGLEDASAIKTEEPIGLYEWALKYRRLEDRVFSLANFAPLQALYEDDHPNIIVQKPAQVGVSEWAISHAIWALAEGARYWNTDLIGLNVAYCFPTLTALRDFSKERVSGIKRESGHLRDLFQGEFDDLGFKQVGDSYFYLRGAWSIDAMISFRADVLILDEFDRMDPAAIQLAYKRLRQSPIGRRVQISTPTLPGKGIHQAYMESDQCEWQTYCSRCQEYFALEFFRDARANGEPHSVWRSWSGEALRGAEIVTTCPSCRSYIDRTGKGRWKAREPEVKSARGYHIPALAFKVVSLNTLAALSVSSNPTVLTEFYRSDLGAPYEASGARLTEDQILRLSSDLPNGLLPQHVEWRKTVMGVDVGSVYHYRIDSERPGDERVYVRAMGEANSFTELSGLMRQYGVKVAVIDALPEINTCREWVNEWSGRAYRAFYQDGLQKWRLKSSGDVQKPKRFPRAVEKDVVDISRTMAMDAVYASIAEGKEVWPGIIVNDDRVRLQMCAPVRVKTLDRHGQERAVWEHTLPDHWFHASVYASIARDILKHERVQHVPGVVALGSARGWVAQ